MCERPWVQSSAPQKQTKDTQNRLSIQAATAVVQMPSALLKPVYYLLSTLIITIFQWHVNIKSKESAITFPMIPATLLSLESLKYCPTEPLPIGHKITWMGRGDCGESDGGRALALHMWVTWVRSPVSICTIRSNS